MMAPRKRLVAWTTILLAIVLVAGTVFLVRATLFGPKTITAYFPTATSVYPGDEIRVSGVKVGQVEKLVPEGTRTKMILKVDHDVPIPADAKAVIVAQNLVAARYVQLAPAYRSEGPTMEDGAVIPMDRTAVPVEWDEIKQQLTRLSTELGPRSGVSGTSVSRFIDSAASAMDGNGQKLRDTLAELSGVGRILAEGSGDIVDIIKNLQTFVTALRDSSSQIVAFEDRLATLTSVVDDNRSDLDAALKDLTVAIGEVQRFVAGSRNQTAEQIQRLGNVTQNLVENRSNLENVLHVAPNAFANGYNIYNPTTGSALGAFVMNNFAGPVQLVCSAIGAIENTTAPETARLCAQYLGPALRLLTANYIPLPINAFLMPSASPQDIEYSEPKLMPDGGRQPVLPPEPKPATSAYTGFEGNPYPAPGTPPPPYTGRLPGEPTPGAQQLLPGGSYVPPSTPITTDQLLMPPASVPGLPPPEAPGTPLAPPAPAQAPPSPGAAPPPGAPLPAEAPLPPGGTP
jgi:phospholipid/cholesterol/gamma-HCH transport system substrate-binding protein